MDDVVKLVRELRDLDGRAHKLRERLIAAAESGGDAEAVAAHVAPHLDTVRRELEAAEQRVGSHLGALHIREALGDRK